MEEVTLVDKEDNVIGREEKIEAHKNPKLHRAISILIFNKKGEMLIHKRADSKYHAPGLWTNACCSHPRPGETYEGAAKRRLPEEMGFSCDLEKEFKFTYFAEFMNGLAEYEMDQIFVGVYEGEIKANPEEVSDYKYVNVEELLKDIYYDPKKYTAWFKTILMHSKFKGVQEKHSIRQ
jgi:isopentenyl-diphosphate Delta-isomerase